jgi:Carboxypeptidase regulatory-like domain/TonB-dependent Receptor Plug Domain
LQFLEISVIARHLYSNLICVLVLVLAVPALAQSTGSIRGTVTDQSGSVVANAASTLTETNTQLSHTAVSNSDGIFVFSDLPIGNYTLTVTASGFTDGVYSGIALVTGHVVDVPVKLSVGSTKEQVTVAADAESIQTTTSTVQQSVTEQQIQNLPLNGRNPLQLTTLVPGTVLTTVGTESGQEDNTGLSVNGLRATQDTYTLDGSIYSNRFFDSVPILPNPDALEEFTVQTANYDASHGGAGALVQLSTRSGTNALHGSAWEFLRNTVLNARNYFQTTVPPYKLNQFGGTVGGPIFKSKRAFFFFSAEDLQQRSSPNPIAIEVPTAAELRGDFSAVAATGVAIYNPANEQIFQGGIITTAMDPLSAAVNKQYLAAAEAVAKPAANNTYATFQSTSNSNIDNTQYLVRLDYDLTSRDHLSGHYFYNQDNFQRPFNAPLGFYAENLFRNQSLTISDVHTFSNSFTGLINVSAFRSGRTQIPIAPGLQTLQSLGMNAPFGSFNENLVPFPGVRANLSGFVDVFSGGALTQDPTSFNVSAQAVKLLRRHTLTGGFDFERSRIDADDYSYTPGDNTFNGQRTQAPSGTVLASGYKSSGNALADFYTGYESSFFQDNGRKFYLREIRPALYLQDDWKVSQRLTLNLGLRWDPWIPPIDGNDTLVGFNLANPTFQSTIAPGAPKGLQFVGDKGVSQSIYKNNFWDFSPRVGFAWNPRGNGDTVVRGAYGLFYGFPEGLLYQRTDAMQPVDLYLNIPNPPQWDSVYAGYPGGTPFPRGHIAPSQFADYTFILPVSGGVLNPASHVAYTQAYNATVEQSLGNGFSLTIAYVGNHAEHIMGSRQFNPAVYAPGRTVGQENSHRIYPGLAAVELADAYEYEIFNSLQVNLTHHVSHGLTLLTNIVWSKNIDNTSSAAEGNTGPPNPFNLQSGRGLSDFDQRIRFNAAVNYLFPTYHGSRLMGALANGWHGNGIVKVQSGLPITILSGVDNSISGVGNDYADYVPGVNPNRPAGASKIKEWFNPAAFTKNAIGTFGDVPRNSLRGPGFADVDVSLFKEILQEHRVHAQFQAESYNLFNHTNLANPTASVSSGTFGQITGTSNSTGTVNMTSVAGSPRVFQFGVKVLF